MYGSANEVSAMERDMLPIESSPISQLDLLSKEMAIQSEFISVLMQRLDAVSHRSDKSQASGTVPTNHSTGHLSSILNEAQRNTTKLNQLLNELII